MLFQKLLLDLSQKRFNTNEFFHNLNVHFNLRTKAEKSAELSSPPGYFPSIGNNQIETIREADSARLIIKKSWDLALGPIKQVKK